MATCGYLCPSCEGKGYDVDGEICSWCSSLASTNQIDLSNEEWIKKVHEGPCCGDIGSKEST